MNLRHLRDNWNALGRADPLWAILTCEAKKGGAWDAGEFFETGRGEIAQVMDYVDRIHPVARRRALDFGCGVGRLTQALAGCFDEAAGVDIAASMIEQAGRYNQRGERCRYYLNTSGNLALFPDSYFDFIYSNITLQHIPPVYVKGYLREFVRVLAPGGVLLFQLTGEPLVRVDRWIQRIVPGRLLGLYRYCYLRWRYPGQPFMQMHGIPRPAVERLLRRAGAKVLDVIADYHPGDRWESFRYCATK